MGAVVWCLWGTVRAVVKLFDGRRAEEQFLRGRIVATQATAALLLFMLIVAWAGACLGVVIANIRRPQRCGCQDF